MGHYHHLTLAERIIIEILIKFNKSPQTIANFLGKAKSTIQRELGKFKSTAEYDAEKAHLIYLANRRRCRRKSLFDDADFAAFVSDKIINCHWSPEQISGWLLRHHPEQYVSFQSIYRTIYSGKLDAHNNMRPISRKLRRKGKRYKSKKLEKRGKIKVNHTIHERPSKVEERSRFGDWEIDTIVGKGGECCIVTIIERVTRFLCAELVYGKESHLVRDAILNELRGKTVYTITSDQGKEFAKYPDIEEGTGATFYFANPHSPWQKGAIENINGLLREYIPKGTNMWKIKKEDVRRFVEELNSRPRKCLGFETPSEAYQKAAHLQ